MGKSFELLGLATFNIFIAIFLSTTFLSKGGEEKISTLTEVHVEKFINEVTEIAGGRREDMDRHGIIEYMMAHIAEESTFVSNIAIDAPHMDTSEKTLEMDKSNYISHTLEGIGQFSKHEAAVEIEYIEIAHNGKEAKVMTTNYERGVMPVDDGFGEMQMIPMTGTSYCEQVLVLSNDNVIQMAGATCSTNIDISDAY